MLAKLFSTQTAYPAPAAAEHSAGPKDIGASLIAENLVFNGTLVTDGDIQIDGHVMGGVRAVRAVVGDKGKIAGDVEAEHLTVHGSITGRIRARRVVLAATGRIEGEIVHEVLTVKIGSLLEGSCRRMGNDDGAMTPQHDATLLSFASAVA